MSRSLKLLAASLVLALAATPALAGGNANFVLGGRTLDEDDWAPAEEHVVFGVTVDFGGEGWPVNLAIGHHLSIGTDEWGPFDLTSTVAELTFGVQKTWVVDGVTRPYIGGGVAAVNAESELELGNLSVTEDDTSGAVYVDGGVFWRLGSRFNIGVEGRLVVGTDLELAGADVNADYFQGGLILGWGWPPD
jgi:hypothetical protein